jgi:DNA-directed RNA polymerase subunit M/transcription elongation factor TFIIS
MRVHECPQCNAALKFTPPDEGDEHADCLWVCTDCGYEEIADEEDEAEYYK